MRTWPPGEVRYCRESSRDGDREDAPGTQYARQFVESAVILVEMLENLGDDDAVEARVPERQPVTAAAYDTPRAGALVRAALVDRHRVELVESDLGLADLLGADVEADAEHALHVTGDAHVPAVATAEIEEATSGSEIESLRLDRQHRRSPPTARWRRPDLAPRAHREICRGLPPRPCPCDATGPSS